MSLRLTAGADHADWSIPLDGTGSGVGLSSLVRRLRRTAVHVRVPARTAAYGFSWARDDDNDPVWYPQGISTSGDATGDGTFEGRQIVLVSWYARRVGDEPSRGTRISVVDISAPTAPRYEHVLLVEPDPNGSSGRQWRPVRVHAGGIAWYRDRLYVADTNHGLRVFALHGIVPLPDPVDGMRYAMPQIGSYHQLEEDASPPFRFSFGSVVRTGDPLQHDHLLVGEYGTGQSHRLALLDVDRGSGALVESDGVVNAHALPDGVGHMQGAVIVGDTTYVCVSRGSWRSGRMLVRIGDGAWRVHRLAHAVGPEDLSYWPQRDQIWTATEYPRRRYVYGSARQLFAG